MYNVYIVYYTLNRDTMYRVEVYKYIYLSKKHYEYINTKTDPGTLFYLL